MKKAIITGITGQDGSYLAEFLSAKGYEIHGLIRPHSVPNTDRIEHLLADKSLSDRIFLHKGDITDGGCMLSLIEAIRPDEIYNLAAQSHVGDSFVMPRYTADVTGIGTLNILEAIRLSKCGAKFYQASTSELFGGLPQSAPQNEKTPFYPKSPYGAAKLYAYWITVNYREAYGIFAVNGILFNHESPRRGENFVTRKITKTIAKIMAGKKDKLALGNLEAKRDWGFAGDYVRGMYLMLQKDCPRDYVLATGETHTVREFAQAAFKAAGINLSWQGSGVDEKGICRKTGKVLVEIDPRFFRPAEVDLLLGDASEAENNLGWRREVDFDGLVEMMVKADLKAEGL